MFTWNVKIMRNCLHFIKILVLKYLGKGTLMVMKQEFGENI